MKLESSTDFWGTQTSSFIKIRAVGAELFHADGRTDTTKLLVAFRNFAKVPKNQFVLYWKTVAVCSRIHTKHKYILSA
jgi:hypothetical protein